MCAGVVFVYSFLMPTRQLPLLDPIIVHEDMSPLSQGIIQVPNETSDHCATYEHIPFEYPLHVTRNVWIYKDANYELFNRKYLILIIICHHQDTVNEASSLFTNIFIEFAKLCKPSKTIVVGENDKQWYDSEIRRNSRKRDRLKKVSNGAKIRNRYNQVPHLTQDTNGKETNSQLYTTNESQEASPFPAGDHKAQINTRAQRHNKHKTEKA